MVELKTDHDLERDITRNLWLFGIFMLFALATAVIGFLYLNIHILIMSVICCCLAMISDNQRGVDLIRYEMRWNK